MDYVKRLELFKSLRSRYNGLLISVLWQLTGDRELFTEAMQYALLGIWENIKKLNSEKAGAYIYRIALSANSKAWRNRIGKDGHFTYEPADNDRDRVDAELAERLRGTIARLPEKQARAIVMRYLEQKDYETIARNLSCSPAGARSHVSKALAGLKRKLTDE